MALARVLQIMAFLIYFKGIHGQLNNLMNNPTVGQNNIKQGFQSTSSIKSVNENLFQNDNLGRDTNFNSQKTINSQYPSISQSSFSVTPQFSVQQPQIISQLINQQPNQISDSQQPLLYQPKSSFTPQPVLPQSSVAQQQPCNFLESSPSIVPFSNAANINYQPKTVTPVVQQIPLQVSQSIPVSKSYVSSYPSTSPVTTYGGQRMDFVTNLSSNYVVPMNALPYSVPEAKVVSSIPIPYTTVLSTSNPTIFGNGVVTPYQTPLFGIYENPLENLSAMALSDEATEFDNLLSLLLSILQSPKKSSKYAQSNKEISSHAPYTPYKMNQGSKSSILKALLPVILNLIKDRREGCGCHSGCKCNHNYKNQNDFEMQCNGGNSKKTAYSLKEEMFNNDESAEDTPRFIRDQQNKKTKNIPEVSIESDENDATDYDDHVSEEEED
ncbi:metal regulatory transcription factor 1-like [Vanessa tameamea]|uniref:Metal regulatory transcription factor 1-like n=1 Tax=Vanessa tameamea TaxID=334116 RepID=A0ABM4B072_VANTA